MLDYRETTKPAIIATAALDQPGDEGWRLWQNNAGLATMNRHNRSRAIVCN